MKYRSRRVLLAFLLLFGILCLSGCGQQEQKHPELYIDPETFSTGFQSELRSVPAFFLRSEDNTVKAVFATALSGQLKRSESGTYEIKEGVLTVIFPESGERVVFVVANATTISLVKEQSTWKYLRQMPEGALFHCIGTVPSEKMPSEDVIE
ncbi:MAG: hypothetical protein IJY28_04115 [Clostridia bacterium]|nr:hypothetical protein [Clostridia bacterium]